MDPVRFGLAVRALRRRRGWTQQRLADAAHVSQGAVSRCERGDADRLTVRTIVKIAEALGARAQLTLLWHGEELDRLVDAAHAGLVDQVAQILVTAGWEVAPEVTFSIYGERGSIDVLAFHAATGSLLIVEVKSAVPDMQAMLASLDRKVRLGPRIATERGWRARTVSRLLVLPDDRTARRRVAEHASTLDRLMPCRTVRVRQWIVAPAASIGGIAFLPSRRRTTGRQRVRGAEAAERPSAARIRRQPAASSGNAGSGRTNSRPSPD